LGGTAFAYNAPYEGAFYMAYEIVIPNGNHQTEAEQIAAWTVAAKTMLPKSKEELQQFFNEGRSVLIRNELGLLAHAAITFFWPDNWAEAGAVAVKPSEWGKGWGSIVVAGLIGMAQDKFADKKLFALCNVHSINLFLRSGGRVISDPNLLPQDVWGECNNCPNFQKAKSEGKLCCDTPVKIG
jgi:N-acetylglutamate synthase-like GNAT family acetyltransferase